MPLYIGCILSSKKRHTTTKSDVVQARIFTGWITLIMLLLTAQVIVQLHSFRLLLFTHQNNSEYAARWSNLHVVTNTLLVASALSADGMMVSLEVTCKVST